MLKRNHSSIIILLIAGILVNACTPVMTSSPTPLHPSPTATVTSTQTPTTTAPANTPSVEPTLNVVPTPTFQSTETTTPTEVSKLETIRVLGEVIGISFVAHTDPRFDNAKDQRFSDHFSGMKPGVFAFQWIHTNGLDAPLNRQLADQWIAEAKANGQNLVGMPLVWHRDATEMLKNNNQEEAIQALENHVRQLLNEFKNVGEWGVLQEATWEAQGTTGFEISPWNASHDRNSIPEYIPRIYRAARNANPEAVLDYSDYGIERGGLKSDKVFNMIQSLNQDIVEGGPLVDRIVFEIQTNGDNPFTMEQLLTQIKRYQEIGVKVGLEVDVYFEKDSTTSVDQRGQIASEIYNSAIKACFQSEWCDQITLYDPIKENSWHKFFNREAFTPFSNTKSETSDDVIFEGILNILKELQINK